MRTRNKRTIKCDLLEMPLAEQIRFVKEVKRILREKAIEAKLWQSLADVDNLKINGEVLYSSNALSVDFAHAKSL